MNIEILSVEEICELLDISRVTFYKLAKQGELPVFKVGGNYRARESDIIAWIENQHRETEVSSVN